ncbi:hypothetical protein HZB07_05800 [Candidatus Saganbacteria bacterium]|nr:hypothetical protein [Candidatus Saganbacteria bacterium]
MRKILIITNGHGEDIVAAELIKRLPADYNIKVLPLVGSGAAFAGLNVSILGERKKLASGGFSLRNFSYLLKDLAQGLAGQTWRQLKLLRGLRSQIDLTIAIGDLVPMIGALTIGCPWIFVGVNKSAYYKKFGSNYTPWERWLLQRARKVFVRDKATEIDLHQGMFKVQSAEYAGNPLLDASGKMTNVQCQMSNEGNIIIGFLPGTRDDAKLNIEDFEKLAIEINKNGNKFKFLIAAKIESIPPLFKKVSFAECLAQADIVIGLSGTGNEQAAGYGIPVISFYGRGSQYNKKFAEAQKELLGDALLLIPDPQPTKVATAILALLANSGQIAKMSTTGKERMGKPGAGQKITAAIIDLMRP